MARYHHNVYAKSKTPRYLVIFDLQWKIIECQRLEPSTDLRPAMAAAIERLTADGWQSEGTPDFGFVFIKPQRHSPIADPDRTRSVRHHATGLLPLQVTGIAPAGLPRSATNGAQAFQFRFTLIAAHRVLWNGISR